MIFLSRVEASGDVVLAERASEPLLKDCTAEDFETVVQAKLVGRCEETQSSLRWKPYRE